MSFFDHEKLHRSTEVMARLQTVPVAVCGAGAVGANLAESLARSGLRYLTAIDDDRVEERNLSTQPYQQADIGAFKAQVLSHMLYRAVGAEVEACLDRLTVQNAEKLLRGSHLVVDAFDNSVSRRAVKEVCAATGMPCLHVGLAAGYGEVIWNDAYRVPSPAQDDVCDYPLARSLVTLVVSVACEVVLRFIATGSQASYTVTLDDFAVRSF